MSGGVDSTVALYLMLSNQFECEGVTMQLLPGENSGSVDAALIADKLNVPFSVVDYIKQFKECVIDYFLDAYEQGLTPNPCVICNKKIKFGELLKLCDQKQCDFLVTGHYATIGERNGSICLMKAKDPAKDQTYFLYNLTPEQLKRIKFPLGGYSKPEIRQIAKANGFVNANRKDSQDICFVPDGDYIKVITEKTDKAYPKGDFIDKQGNVLGKHDGIIKYTIGQRKGLGIALGKSMYVCDKNSKTNTVTLCEDAELYKTELLADDFNWIIPPEAKTFKCNAKIRYRHEEQPATVTIEDDIVKVVFDEPQRAITPGQSVVLYDGDYVLGGGIIKQKLI